MICGLDEMAERIEPVNAACVEVDGDIVVRVYGGSGYVGVELDAFSLVDPEYDGGPVDGKELEYVIEAIETLAGKLRRVAERAREIADE